MNTVKTVSSSELDSCGLGNELATTVTVNQPDPSTWLTVVGALDVSIECDDTTALANAQALTPEASCPNFTPIKTSGAFVQDSSSCSSNGTYTNTWTFTDNCGNTIENYVQTITVSDNTPPDLTNCSLINQTFECSLLDNEANIEDWNLTNISILEGCSTNNCSNTSVTVTSNYLFSNFIDSCGSTGSITVTYTVGDDCGNTSTIDATFTVTDTTPPDLSNCVIPTIETIECGDVAINQSNAALWNNETITTLRLCGIDDCNVDLADAVTSDFDYANLVVNTADCTSSIETTFFVEDDCGNITEYIATLVFEDTTPPVFVETLPASTTVDFNAIPVAEILTATDVCGDAPVTFNETINGDICDGTYNITRTWTATDSCGLTTEHVQVLTVIQPALQTGASSTDETCNNCDDGTLSATPTGGSGTYVSYIWDLLSLEAGGSSQTAIYNTQNVTNVPPGTYQVTVTDSNGCTATDSVVMLV